jgi:peptidoglycan hydrolase-like protein with peptidoglycan-binding domain
MTAGDLKLTSMALAGLTLTVGINLFFLQEKHAARPIETSSLAANRTFEATVQQALGNAPGNASGQDLGPPMAQGAVTLKLQPPGISAADATSNAAEIIRGIQRELNARGYEAGQPDGVAGLVTRAAIMAYEHDYGLALTATPGQDLLSRIVLGSSVPSAPRGAADKIGAGEAESVALMVEQQLASLGYTPGKADGKLNEQTARAIREFETDQKLAQTGRISGPLVSRLLKVQGQAAKLPVTPPVTKPIAAKAEPAKGKMVQK